MMKIFATTISIILFLLTFILGQSIFIEGYNPIKPDIDTRYSSTYNEEKFNTIAIGMDSIEIIELIGFPYSKYSIKSNLYWSYTGDGKCNWHDFAWLGREIVFDKKGKVVRVNKLIYYD